MPMGKAYDNMLKSHIADMKNIGGPYGGSITAACFLSVLSKITRHGYIWISLARHGQIKTDQPFQKGGTGYGVRLLNQLVDNWQESRIKNPVIKKGNNANAAMQDKAPYKLISTT